jgi:S1-C subfamily serine protease
VYKHLLALLLALFLITACTSQSPAYSPTPALVAEINRETAALVMPDGSIYCSAVWVARDRLLTAAHCVRAMRVMQMFGMTPMFQADETAKPEPVAELLKYDVAHDLALLRTPTNRLHGSATLAVFTPAKGETVHVVGHAGAISWMYCHGYVGSYLPADFFGSQPGAVGPFLQLSAPIFKGHSGAAVFDANGNIVGIVSRASEVIPDFAIVVHLDTIRKFLNE